MAKVIYEENWDGECTAVEFCSTRARGTPLYKIERPLSHMVERRNRDSFDRSIVQLASITLPISDAEAVKLGSTPNHIFDKLRQKKYRVTLTVEEIE